MHVIVEHSNMRLSLVPRPSSYSVEGGLGMRLHETVKEG